MIEVSWPVRSKPPAWVMPVANIAPKTEKLKSVRFILISLVILNKLNTCLNN
jgi:hypothetical protein